MIQLRRESVEALREVTLKEHGQFESAFTGQVVMFAARGPWNDEAMTNGSKQLGRVIAQVDKSKPWAQISCLSGEAIMPPSTFEIFVEQSKLRRKAGMLALALVICDSDIIFTIKQQMSACYDQAGLNYAFFDDIASAADWLEELGVDVERDNVRQFYQAIPFLPDNIYP